jgi:hypothetical protein
MRSINLSEDLACVDEEHFILVLRLLLASVEEPKSTGQRHGVEEI